MSNAKTPSSEKNGGWSSYSTPTPAEREIFNEAVKGRLGVSYTPEQVSTQTVAGMNYRFICKAVVIEPNATPFTVTVFIYDPLEGAPSITSITSDEAKTETPIVGSKPMQKTEVEYLANNNWQFQLGSNNDLFAIKKSNTGSNSTELHVLQATTPPGQPSYSFFNLETGTKFPETGDNWQFLIADNRDLIGIKQRDTGTNSTEVHIATASSGYKSWNNETGTCLHETGDNWQFLVAVNRDIYAIKKSKTGTNKTEVHILSAIHNYQQYSLEKGTILNETGANWTFALADNNDLIGIMKSDTVSKMTEVHILDHSTNYQSYKLEHATTLHEVGDNFSFLISKNLELFAIKENNTGTATTEVHIMNPATKYTTWLLETGTALVEVNDEKPTLIQGDIALYSGINQTGRSWKINGNLSDLSSLSSLITPFYSIDLGLKTGANIYQGSSFQGAQHTYINKANLDGLSFDSLKVWNNESLAKTGISYSSLMTEDYKYNKNQPPQLEKFNSFQTIITVPTEATRVDVYAGKEVVITVNDIDYTIDNVKSQTFPIQSGQNLIITTPATQLGSSYYRVSTNTMEDGEFVLVFPDAHLHNKIARLPAGSLNNNREKLNLAANVTSDNCDAIQSALSNIAKSVTYPAGDNPIEKNLNNQSMEHNHWSLDYSSGNPTYQALTKKESAQILAKSTPLNGNGVASLFGDIGGDLTSITKIVVHTIVHTANSVANTAENIAKNEVKKASALYHSAIATCNDLEKGDFSGAAHSVESGLSDAASMASDIEKGPLTIIGAAMPTALVEKTVLATLQIADKSVSFVINHTGVVGEIIGFVIQKIGAEIDKAVNWLKSEIGWNDVLRIQGEYNSIFNSAVAKIPGMLQDYSTEVNSVFDGLKPKINSSINKIENELGVDSIPNGNPTSSEVSHRIAWLTSKLVQNVSNGTVIQSNTSKPSNTLTNATTKYLEDVEKTGLNAITAEFRKISNAFGEVIAKSGHTPEILLSTLLGGIKNIADDIIGFGNQSSNFFTENADSIFSAVSTDLTKEIEMPFFTDLFRMFFPKEKLSVLSLSTLFPAIAVAIEDKNCGKGQTLTLSANSEVLFANKMIFFIDIVLTPFVILGDIDKKKKEEKSKEEFIISLPNNIATLRLIRCGLHLFKLLSNKNETNAKLQNFFCITSFLPPMMSILYSKKIYSVGNEQKGLSEIEKISLIMMNVVTLIGETTIASSSEEAVLERINGVLPSAQTTISGINMYIEDFETAIIFDSFLGSAIIACSGGIAYE